MQLNAKYLVSQFVKGFATPTNELLVSFVIKDETREESPFSVQRCSVSTCLAQAQSVQDNVTKYLAL